MSIYFVHFLQIFLPLSFFSAIFLRIFSLKNYVIFGIVGSAFAFIASYIANLSLASENLSFFANHILLLSLIAMIIIYPIPRFNKIPLLNYSLFALLVLSFSIRYLYISMDFKIFSIGFLDTLAINSMALIVLALLICVITFLLTRLFLQYAKWQTYIAGIIGIFVFANSVVADILLIFVRKNIIIPSEMIMSYIGKSVYYAFLNPYIITFLFFLLGILSLTKIPKATKKHHLFDIIYRKNTAIATNIKNRFALSFVVVVVSCGILLFYDLYASKPITLDPAQELDEPNGGIFTFPTSLLSDNNLHRFAYITDEGKEVRFFLLNKFEGRSSPAVAFDACALCGDMGYIKKGGELICIACNVRIFLPSIGKFGGCNPIPLPFVVENDMIKIKKTDVIAGSNYFSKVVPKKVKDPVNGEEFFNNEALFNYSYKGITYFFSQEKSYEAFIKEPEKYVKHDLEAMYRIQRYYNELENN